MMGKIKSLLGSPRPEREAYEQEMQRLRAKDALRDQYSQASPYQQASQASQASHGLGQQYHASQVWDNKPASPEEYVMREVVNTNQAMKHLAERMDTQERRVQMLTGFYTWVTEVHPEITAQHKAMRDLYEAANAPQQEQGKQDA
jgi:hypothetical protein